jgi:hypothetical protein
MHNYKISSFQSLSNCQQTVEDLEISADDKNKQILPSGRLVCQIYTLDEELRHDQQEDELFALHTQVLISTWIDEGTSTTSSTGKPKNK